MGQHWNPVLPGDFPQNDIVRVGTTYYMATTSMHFYPGCTLLVSRDLIHWKIQGHVFTSLENSSGEMLEQESNLYGKGFRVGGLTYREGSFYLFGASRGTQKAYIFHATAFGGPWSKISLDRYYHDGSLVFDEDGTPFVCHGYDEIRLTEFRKDLTGAADNGLDVIIYRDPDKRFYSYGGAHIMKKNGKIYIFFTIWSQSGGAERHHMCYMSDRWQGPYACREMLMPDREMPPYQRVALGGIVDTPDGRWYGMMTQGHEGIGRMPFLVPIDFRNPFPVVAESGVLPEQPDLPPGETPEQNLFGSDSFESRDLMPAWQWNHMPDNRLWEIEKGGGLRITSGKISINLLQARNTLTQRMHYPYSEAEIRVDGSDMHNGDVAGLCALISGYGFVGLTRENGKYYVIMGARDVRNTPIRDKLFDYMPGKEYERIPVRDPRVTFRLSADFGKKAGTAEFFFKPTEENGRDSAAYLYRKDEEELVGGWHKVGINHKITYNPIHFAGCRYGLFLYSTKDIGGSVLFQQFRYYRKRDRTE